MLPGIIRVDDKPVLDEQITYYQLHTRKPFDKNLNHNDIISIAINNQDAYTYPAGSYLYVKGKLSPRATSAFVNNGPAFLFDHIKFLIAGEIVASVRHVGLTSTIKGYLSFTSGEILQLSNAGWYDPIKDAAVSQATHDASGAVSNFEVCIPLRTLLGFAEDYDKMIMNVKQELILVRSRNDNEALITTAAADPAAQVYGKVDLEEVSWRFHQIKLDPKTNAKLLNNIAVPKTLTFRSWELYEYPSVPQTTKFSWPVKTSTQVEKPRYVIFCMQTNRTNNQLRDSSKFDDCKVRSVKLFLNSECYPVEGLDLNFTDNRVAVGYEMFSRFTQSYYYDSNRHPALDRKSWKSKYPMIVIDCSQQSEAIKVGPVDATLEVECSENIPENTMALCLIIHDTIYQYNAATGTITSVR